MNALHSWAIRYNIPPDAIRELRSILVVPTANRVSDGDAGDEAKVQAKIRVEASRKGWLLFRNNVGAGKLDNGSFLRWGLANDSAALNSRVKSADLIGVRPVLISPRHIGRTIGQFVSVECKRAGWTYRGNDREQAQLRWAEAILGAGGHAVFATGPADI